VKLIQIDKDTRYSRITFDLAKDEIRFKKGFVPLEHKDNILYIIKEIEKFLIANANICTIRGTFLCKPNIITISLKNNSKKSIVSAVLLIKNNIKKISVRNCQ
jgi:hypothetical protein